jgi:hypothetical protein
MILTNRIISGFDVELQLGAGWFLTAFRALNERGLLLPGGPPPPFDPDAPVTVESVDINFDSTDRDLVAQVVVDGIPLTIFISLELSDDGSELVITNSVPNSDPINVPFDALSGLAGPPRLLKLRGGDGHDPCMAFLANLDLRASPQDQEPLPEGEHVERGTEIAVSFLPAGQDIAIGIGAATFPRIANDIWHTSLRVEDGSHPFPDEEDRQGTWKSAEVKPQDGRIRITLKADVPVTGPDADVTITIDLKPGVAGGVVTFQVDVDTNVDTGILGSIFAFFVGGVLGFFVGLIFGGGLAGAAIGAGIGAFGGVIFVEIKEATNEGKIKRKVVASLEGEEIPPIYTCEDGIVVEAEPSEEDAGLVGSFVNAIPRSIPVGSDEPDPLHKRTVVVEALYDEFQMDESGLAFAGTVQAGERFQPLPATLIDRRREGDRLLSLVYRTPDDEEVEIPLDVVLERMEEAELRAPYKISIPPADSEARIPAGRLPSVCLFADAIRRSDTIVREIQFTSGLDLKVSEAIELQDAGALILRGLQLIHPKNANPYYRAPANSDTDDNFEMLPRF